MAKTIDCGRWRKDGKPLTIAQQVRRARMGSGLSQRGAAAVVRISFVHLNRVEKGHAVASATLLAKLAGAFSVRFAVWPESEVDDAKP